MDRAIAPISESFMTRIIRGLVAAALLASIAACATNPPPQDPGPAPGRKLDAKTQLECGSKRGCR